MEIKKVTSYTKPKYIDVESSPTTVYVCKDIHEYVEPLKIEGSEKVIPKFSYKMYSYSKSEFELIEQFLDNDIIINELKSDIEILKKDIAELKKSDSGGEA